MTLPRRGLLLLALLIAPLAARAAEPVKRIAIYVEPYYAAGKTPAERPRVAVGESAGRRGGAWGERVPALPASNAREPIVRGREQLQAKPPLVTPMAMMVLAIRL